MEGAFVQTPLGAYLDYQLSAGGYTGVWATENTREAVWDAMARRETYATTGPRMTVRLFGEHDYAVDEAVGLTPDLTRAFHFDAAGQRMR
jgi:hypothetical protein